MRFHMHKLYVVGLAAAACTTTTSAFVTPLPSHKSSLPNPRIALACPSSRPTGSKFVSSSSSLQVSTFPDVSSTTTTDNGDSSTNMPVLGADGVYEVNNEEEYAALMESSKKKLVILKVFAPWCRACKAMAPKFSVIARDPKFNENIPIVWASLSVQHNKDFINKLGVKELPSVQFYVGGRKDDSFACGPSKVPILRKKLAALINDKVDPMTRFLKQSALAEVPNFDAQAFEEELEEFASEFDLEEFA